MSGRDDLFAKELERVSGFRFDDRVARVFPDMINRSVPGYNAIVAMTGQLAGHYASPGSRCYDLGCSRGGSTLAIAAAVPDDCQVIGIDNSAAMIDLLQADLASIPNGTQIELRCADILEEPIGNASFVAMNFTLQFIPPLQRTELLTQIGRGINAGGALLLSEKIRFEDTQMNELMTNLYYDFKRAQGYSDLEISQKRSALEDVLVPETPAEHFTRLKSAGFSQATIWFQCLNFCSFLALR